MDRNGFTTKTLMSGSSTPSKFNFRDVGSVGGCSLSLSLPPSPPLSLCLSLPLSICFSTCRTISHKHSPPRTSSTSEEDSDGFWGDRGKGTFKRRRQRRKKAMEQARKEARRAARANRVRRAPSGTKRVRLTDEEKAERLKARLEARAARRAAKQKSRAPRGVLLASNVSVKRRKKVDPSKPRYYRIPNPPLPLSWAKIIEPMKPATEIVGSKLIEAPVLDFDLTSLGHDFTGIYMNPPWKKFNQPLQPGQITAEDFAKLQLPREVLDVGLIFIWVEKEVIHAVLDALEKWEYRYVENLVWVRENVDNTFRHDPGQFFRTTKSTLLICRKENKKRLELRHQRTPDVIFDFVRQDRASGREHRPDATYHMIETMLPTALYNEERGHGKLLELYVSCLI